MQQKFKISLLLLAVSAIIFQSCKNEIDDYVPRESINGDAAFLRVVNTSSIPRKLDFFITSQKLSGDSIAQGGTFPVSEFLRIPSGNTAFRATTQGSEVYTSNFAFEQGKYNTLFLIDTLPTIDGYLVTDNQLAPSTETGKAHIRLVHVGKNVANASLANTTVTTAVDTVIKNVGYKTHTDFIVVNAGSQKFQLFQAGTTTKIGSELTATITANRMYTFYVRGRAATGNAYPPGLSVITTR